MLGTDAFPRWNQGAEDDVGASAIMARLDQDRQPNACQLYARGISLFSQEPWLLDPRRTLLT